MQQPLPVQLTPNPQDETATPVEAQLSAAAAAQIDTATRALSLLRGLGGDVRWRYPGVQLPNLRAELLWVVAGCSEGDVRAELLDLVGLVGLGIRWGED